MKKDTKELMQDALGLLNDDLIADAQTARTLTRKRTSFRMMIAACLAVLIVAGVCIGAVMHRNADAPRDGRLYAVQNVWEREDFTSVAFLFQKNNGGSLMSGISRGDFIMLSNRFGVVQAEETENVSGAQTIEAENLSVGQDASIGFENLIADRYAVAYDEHFCPVFYDLEQNTVVDLDAQIIGDKRVSLDPLLKACFTHAEKLYPGILSTQNNRDLLTEFVYGESRDLVEWRSKYDTFQPDLEFFSDIDGYRYYSDESLRELFFSECFFMIYRAAYEELEGLYQGKPYWVEVMGIDGKNGTCLVSIHDVVDNGLDYVLYDFKTDSCTKLPDNAQNSLLGTMWVYGDSEFRFSADGKVITVVYPDAGYLGGNVKKSYLDRYLIKSDRDLYTYNGERVGVFYLEHGTAVKLSTRASSEAFLSDSGNVVYYKKCERVRSEHVETDEWGGESVQSSVKCSDELWYSRLYSPDKDTDQWVFSVIDPKNSRVASEIVLQGKFVRFMIDETVVLMEKDGVYTAYELASGKDVTAEVSSSTYGEDGYPYHERLVVYEEDGVLYRKDVFGVFESVELARADHHVLSEDGAFVFAYNSQTGKTLCVNVANNDSVEVELSDEFLRQLSENPNATLVITYNEYENTLLFSLSTQQRDELRRAELAQTFAETMLDP